MSSRPALTVISAALALGACGNLVTTDIVGITGLTLGPDGRPVAIVAACGAAYDRIGVSEFLDRSTAPATQENQTLVTLSRDGDLTGTETVSLTDPVPPWTAGARFDPTGADGFDVAAYANGADRTTTSVTVTRAAYLQLTADRVLVREGESWSRAEFDARACDRGAWPTVTES